MFGIRQFIINNSLIFSKGLLVTGFISALTASLTSGTNLEGFPWDYSYYHLNAIAFSAYLTAFYLIILNGTPNWSKGWQNFTLLVVLSSFSTIGDEIAGNGREVDWQDASRITTTVLIYACLSKKSNQKWMT